MSIRRFFTENLNKQANRNVLVEGWTEYYSNGPYTASMDDDAFSQFDGEMFPMDFTIEKKGERIKEIRGLANARNYIDALVKMETKGLVYPCGVDGEDYYEFDQPIIGSWYCVDYEGRDDYTFISCDNTSVNMCAFCSISLKDYGICEIRCNILFNDDILDVIADAFVAAGKEADWHNRGFSDDCLLITQTNKAYDSDEAITTFENLLLDIEKRPNHYVELFCKQIKDKFGVDVKVTL